MTFADAENRWGIRIYKMLFLDCEGLCIDVADANPSFWRDTDFEPVEVSSLHQILLPAHSYSRFKRSPAKRILQCS